jgi:sugar/nucleoside kinase (ribokinase family)
VTQAAPAPEIVCVGMSTVDVWIQGFTASPPPGGVSFVDTIGAGVGGDALNQAITLASLGHRTALFSVVGADSAGQMVRQLTSAAGVDVAGLVEDESLMTSMAIALIDPQGERSFLAHQHGSVHRLGARHLPPSRLRPGLKVLSVGSLMCSAELDTEGLYPLLVRARELGAVTIADMVADRAEATLEELRPVLSQLDYLIPSQIEAEHYTGTADPGAAAQIFAGYGVDAVVIKQGAAGATAFTKKERWHVDSYDVPVRDTTGSGDNFVAGFASGLSAGLPITQCLQRGSATAALSVQHVGSSGGVDSLTAVQQMINRGRLRPLVTL